MSDPTIPTTKERKKIMFYESPDRQIKLRIKCDYDGFSQSQFLRMMVQGYIEDDQLIRDFIDSYKEKYAMQGSKKRNKIRKLDKKSTETKKKFALPDEELESIFDIIEMETGL